MIKKCGKCKKLKRFWEFNRNKNREFGLGSYCKECRRKNRKKREKYHKEYRKANKKHIKKIQKEWVEKNSEHRKKYMEIYNENNRRKFQDYHIKKNYRITLEERNIMIEKQNNKCKICEIEFDENIRKLKPCIDHNHKTGVIRGILCDNCNKAIGLLNHSIKVLKNSIEYLNKGNLI